MIKIGVMADGLRMPLEDSLKFCRDIGCSGVQLYAVGGDMAPENMNSEKIAKLNKMLADNNLIISALCGDLGGHGFCLKEENREKIVRSKRIVDLAVELGSHIVTTHIGVIPADDRCERYKIMREACNELAEYAQNKNCRFAVETGPEPAERLKSFLDSLESRGVAVNLDPANLVMVTGDDPVKAVYTLKDYVVHTHVKDGIMYKKTDPQIIYDFFAEGSIGDLRLKDYFLETPLGKGSVNFKEYFGALKNIGYTGFLTVEREVGDNPQKDISDAVKFIKENY